MMMLQIMVWEWLLKLLKSWSKSIKSGTNCINHLISFSKELRDSLVADFTKQLSTRVKMVHDKDRNSSIVSVLVALRAKESIDVIRDCFLNESIDPDFLQPYATILKELEVPISNDDELVTKCAHCQRPVEICRSELTDVHFEIQYKITNFI